MNVEDNPFVDSRMQVDEPDNDQTIPTTPKKPTPTPQSTSRRVSIPDQAFQEMCEDLEFYNIQSSPDGLIQRRLGSIFAIIYNALDNDENRKSRRADNKEFKQNLKKRGEEHFFNLLRDIAGRRAWGELLDDGMLFLVSDLKHSNRGLSLEVFLKQPVPAWNPAQASMNGAQ
jgi:hypothetical protein